MPPKFIFVRHGEAEHNAAFHAIGASVFTDEKYRDPPLTQRGIIQARELGARLDALKICAIWSSPLTRAVQTAEEIVEEVDCPFDELYLHDNLVEMLGAGHKCNERKNKYEIIKRFRLWNTDFLPTVASSWLLAENIYSVRMRMQMLVLALADIYKYESNDRHIIIVSHANAIESITRVKLENAAFVILNLEEILAN